MSRSLFLRKRWVRATPSQRRLRCAGSLNKIDATVEYGFWEVIWRQASARFSARRPGIADTATPSTTGLRPSLHLPLLPKRLSF